MLFEANFKKLSPGMPIIQNIMERQEVS